MISLDRDALICDLAETYHIFNYKELPARQVALLSAGLRDNSRIKLKMMGMKCSIDTLLLANIQDRLSILVWMNTKDGQSGKNKPKSVAEQFIDVENETEIIGFSSASEFEEYRNRILMEV